jgi:hypothetical protein
MALRDRMTILFHFLLHYEICNLASSKHRQVAASTLPASKQQRLPAFLACFDALLCYRVSCAYATFRSTDPCNRCRQIKIIQYVCKLFVLLPLQLVLQNIILSF